jgi:hypothetical protein
MVKGGVLAGDAAGTLVGTCEALSLLRLDSPLAVASPPVRAWLVGACGPTGAERASGGVKVVMFPHELLGRWGAKGAPGLHLSDR